MRSYVLAATLTPALAFVVILTGHAATGAKKNSAPKEKRIVETVVYKKVGNCDIKADVHRLPGDDVRPALMWIHGGALMAGQRTSIRAPHFEAYLKEGFTVVSIDYRLAPETKLPGIIADLKDAYQWMRREAKQLRIDPERIGVVGHSAGGYLTLMAGFVLEPRPRALVAFYGYGDIIAPWYSRPEPFYVKNFPAVTEAEARAGIADHEISELIDKEFAQKRRNVYLYCRQQGLWPKWVMDADPDKEPMKFQPYCPEKNVTKDYPPTLLLHGTKDTDVPYEQSARMAAELKRHGVPHRLITMEGLGHGFDGSAQNEAAVQKAFADVVRFLKKRLTGG